ncbi:MAG: hypothetical protein GTN74_04760 [Proteobacteria bacterium]|nr:hypothetical protein [Pseudomonadota bacterium]NIS68767.1 hypothetical protein [Pseudomonadota bacterium]
MPAANVGLAILIGACFTTRFSWSVQESHAGLGDELGDEEIGMLSCTPIPGPA